MYRDHYYPKLTEPDYSEHKNHVGKDVLSFCHRESLPTFRTEHCIELLREAIICQGDIAVTPFKWLGDSFEPTPKDGVMHQCVNWDRLSGWAQERAVDLYDPELLVKPARSEKI